jgi:hypothetical protein
MTDKMNVVISGGWNGGSVARAAGRTLATLGKVVLNIIIWLGIFSPVWIIAGGLVFFFRWRSKKKRQQKPPTPSSTAGSPPGPPAPSGKK